MNTHQIQKARSELHDLMIKMGFSEEGAKMWANMDGMPSENLFSNGGLAELLPRFRHIQALLQEKNERYEANDR